MGEASIKGRKCWEGCGENEPHYADEAEIRAIHFAISVVMPLAEASHPTELCQSSRIYGLRTQSQHVVEMAVCPSSFAAIFTVKSWNEHGCPRA